MSKVYQIAANPDTIRFYLNHSYLYPYGNTPASDLTRGCQTNSDVDFLLLGCGDIRNILFTIKSLVDVKSKCKNLLFHLNDFEDVILARNVVLFNILDRTDPDKDEDMDFLWSVWYDMVIPKEYSKRLVYIMQDLLQNPNLRVEYRTEETKEEVKRVLKYWLKGNMSIENAKNKRFEVVKERLEHSKMLGNTIIPHQMYDEVQVNEWVQEIHNFVEGGSTCKGALKGPVNRYTNPTLLCPHVNGWRAHPSGTPFDSYNLYGLTEGKNLFHNCLSQLKTMVRAWIQFTSRKDSNVKVFLWLGHCLTLCNHTLPSDMKFDFIDTSNIADHVGLLNLLVSCSGRLKPSGVLTTETMRGGKCFDSMEHYLNFSIGVSSSFFPTMFSLRLAEDFEMGTSEPRGISSPVGPERVIIRWLEAGKAAEPIDINDSPDFLKIFRDLVQTCMPLQLQASIATSQASKTPSLLVHIVRKMKDTVVGGAKTLLDIIISSQPCLKTKSGKVFYPHENSLRATWSAYRDQLGCEWPRGHDEHRIVMLDVETRPIRAAGFSKEMQHSGTVFRNSGDYKTMAQHVVPPTEPWFFVTTITYEMVGRIKLLLPSDVWETLGNSSCLAICSFSDSAELTFVPIAIKEDPRVKIVECLQITSTPVTEEEKTRNLRVTEYEDRYEIHLKWHDGLGEHSNLKVARGSDPTELFIGSKSASSTFRVRCPLLDVQTLWSVSHNSWKITATKDLGVLNGPLILKYRRLDIGNCPTVTMTPEQFQKILSNNITHEKIKRMTIETNDPLFNVAKHLLSILELAMIKHPLKPLLRAYFICVKERHYGQTFGAVSNDIFIHVRECHMVHGILTLDIDWVDFEKVNLYIKEGKLSKREVDLYCDTHGGQSGATHHLFEVTQKEALLLRKWLILNTMKSKQRQKGQRFQWVFNSFLQPVFTINNNNVDETQKKAMTEAFVHCLFSGIGTKEAKLNSSINEKLDKSEKVCLRCLRPSALLRACSRCRSAFYCGKECQTRDWPNHKQSCKGKRDTQPNLIATEKVQTKSDKVCSSCSCQSPLLKACTGCHSALYCGKECQMRDWPNHKQLCKSDRQPHTIVTEIVPEKVCSSCSRQAPHLRTCTRCHLAFYCGKECQTRDWPNHKQSCKRDTQPSLIATEEVQTKSEKVCSSCSCEAPLLRACTGCHSAFYCGKECQMRDWPNHKQSCTRLLQPCGRNSSSIEKVTQFDKVCKSCLRQDSDLKLCTKCKSSFYCGRECQKRDWPNHKETCRGIRDNETTIHHSSATEELQKLERACSSCSMQASDLKVCTRCQSVFYCGRRCQKRDWPYHQLTCKIHKRYQRIVLDRYKEILFE